MGEGKPQFGLQVIFPGGHWLVSRILGFHLGGCQNDPHSFPTNHCVASVSLIQLCLCLSWGLTFCGFHDSWGHSNFCQLVQGFHYLNSPCSCLFQGVCCIYDVLYPKIVETGSHQLGLTKCSHILCTPTIQSRASQAICNEASFPQPPALSWVDTFIHKNEIKVKF